MAPVGEMNEIKNVARDLAKVELRGRRKGLNGCIMRILERYTLRRGAGEKSSPPVLTSSGEPGGGLGAGNPSVQGL